MPRTWILCSLLLLLTPPAAQAEELYLGANPSNTGLLTLVGLGPETTFQVTNLDSDAPITAGELDRFTAVEIDLTEVHHFAVTASRALLVYLGWDCCGVGGSTFVPTEDGHARVGRAFALYLPVLGTQADVVVYAVEDAEVVLADAAGVPITRRSLTSGRAWLPYPLVGARPYLLRSTGDVAVMLSAVNGLASVPPASREGSCDSDVGRLFYLNTHSWGTGAVAVFAYEDGEVTLEPIGGGDPVLAEAVEAGGWLYRHELGRRSYRVTSTGDVAVWAGDLEGGTTISDIGDDFSCNLGRGGQEVLIHSQNHGATVFAAYDETSLLIGEEEHRLDRGQWIDIEAGVVAWVRSDRPVITLTFGGNTLNDWGGFLRPAPRDPPDEACPNLDADLPQPPDGGPDADADADADTDVRLDGDLDLDAELDEAGVTDASVDAGDAGPPSPRRSCDCRAAGRSIRGPTSFLAILARLTLW